MQAKGYGSTVTFDGENIIIERNKIIASQYGFDRTVVPLSSIVDVTEGRATLLTNGLFCLSVRTANGDTKLIGSATQSRKSPYCAIYTRSHSDEFKKLASQIRAVKPSQAVPIAIDQTDETRYARQIRSIERGEEAQRELDAAMRAINPSGRKLDSFKGSDGTRFELFEHEIHCGRERYALDGVTASVLDGSALESRVTLTRLLLVGVFALAFKKRKGGEKYLTIEGPDFAWMSEVNRKHVSDAMKFATKVQNQARKA